MPGFIITLTGSSCPWKLSQTSLARKGFQEGTTLTWGHRAVGNSGDPEEGISLMVFALHLEIKSLLRYLEGWPSPQLMGGAIGKELCGQSEEGLP